MVAVKNMPKFKVGDNVCVMNMSGMDFYGRDTPAGEVKTTAELGMQFFFESDIPKKVA